MQHAISSASWSFLMLFVSSANSSGARIEQPFQHQCRSFALHLAWPGNGVLGSPASAKQDDKTPDASLATSERAGVRVYGLSWVQEGRGNMHLVPQKKLEDRAGGRSGGVAQNRRKGGAKKSGSRSASRGRPAFWKSLILAHTHNLTDRERERHRSVCACEEGHLGYLTWDADLSERVLADDAILTF